MLADPRVRHVDVVELAPAARRLGPRPGWCAELAGLEGERCTLHVADVLDVLGGRCAPRGPWDVVLLDVDNGPDFLVHASNAALYDRTGSRRPARRCARAGCSWCGPRTWRRPCYAALREVAADGDEVTEDVVEVEREGRRFRYALYSLARRRRPERMAP